MSNKIASRQAVFAVADGLKAQGEEPTYERVIELLGGGSNSTVGPHLAVWKESNCAPPRAVPETVVLRGTVLVDAIWRAALVESQIDIEQTKQAAASEIEQANLALTSSIAISEKLEAERDVLIAQVESLESDCLLARLELRQVDELRLELAQAQQCAELRRQEGETLQRTIAELTGQVASLKAQGELLIARLGPTLPTSRPTSRRGRKSTS